MNKKILSIVLALLLLISCCVTSMGAEEYEDNPTEKIRNDSGDGECDNDDAINMDRNNQDRSQYDTNN